MSLSSKLGPRARNLASLSTSEIVDGLVEIDRTADLRSVTRQLRKAGADVFVSPRALNIGFIGVEVRADHLNEVAKITDVIYLEADPRR